MSSDWEDQAVCRGMDTDLWFPSGGGDTGYRRPRRICQSCPVQNECLDDVLGFETPAHRYGMRAGLMPRERAAIASRSRPRPDLRPVRPAPQLPALRPAQPRGEISVTVTDITPPPVPQLDPRDVQPDTAEALIAWGAAHASSRIQALSGRAHGALADLRQAAERETKVAEAEARVGRLEAQLANARRDLASAKGTSKPKPATPQSAVRPDTEELRAIRKWAAATGHQVAPKGLIARAVIEAYRAAHADPQPTGIELVHAS